MLAKSFVLACAASGLLAGAAMAQDATKDTVKAAPPEQIEDNPNSPLTVNPPSDATVLPARPADTGSLSATSAAVPSGSSMPSLTVETVTNGPVPDTSENRAKYGLPDSNAGKRTAARGN